VQGPALKLHYLLKRGRMKTEYALSREKTKFHWILDKVFVG
jgi:hypothetical protein